MFKKKIKYKKNPDCKIWAQTTNKMQVAVLYSGLPGCKGFNSKVLPDGYGFGIEFRSTPSAQWNSTETYSGKNCGL